MQFLKDTKQKNEEKYTESAQRLIKQLSQLNDLLTQEKKEKDEYFHQLCEKESTLQLTIVHLQSAQEEVQRLLHEKSQHFKARKESIQEM